MINLVVNAKGMRSNPGEIMARLVLADIHFCDAPYFAYPYSLETTREAALYDEFMEETLQKFV